MNRRRECSCLFLIAVWTLVLSGCTSSEERPEPVTRQVGGLMPPAEPITDREYVADQSQVKVVVQREPITLDPLETYRQRNAERAKARLARLDVPIEMPGTTAVAPALGGAPTSGGAPDGFWKRLGLKALTGGAAPPTGEPAASDEDAPKGDMPATEDAAATEETDRNSDDGDSSDDDFKVGDDSEDDDSEEEE